MIISCPAPIRTIPRLVNIEAEHFDKPGTLSKHFVHMENCNIFLRLKRSLAKIASNDNKRDNPTEQLFIIWTPQLKHGIVKKGA